MNAPSDPEDPHDANYLRETSVRFLTLFLFCSLKVLLIVLL